MATYNHTVEGDPWSGRQNADAPTQKYEEFLTELAKKPGLVGADGKMTGNKGDGPYDSEGKTPKEYFDQMMATKINDGFTGYGDDMKENMVDRKFVDLARTEDTRSQGLKVGLGMLAAPFVASAVGGWAAASPAATPATGLAGTIGMNAGAGATALNAGALNTGISLVQGKNIGDSLKSGVMAAALSPVGGWAKGAIGEATAGLGAGVSKVLSTVGAGAATGAAGAALTGQDVGKGLTNGIISGAIGAVSGAAGKMAKDATGSDLVGGVTKAGVSGVISGKKKNLATAAINGALDDLTNPMASVNKYLGWANA